MVHGAVEALGLDGVGTAEENPGIGREAAGSLGLAGLGEVTARVGQDAAQSVDDVRGLSRHG